ncbi:hypothetical protein DB88DRAFT_485114 [Papiliotrema laurentii]|uniref:GRIP domain-containing protein n=1 Tax=Papiliotrema laurentii TaxID=5418 RepID=A0AAD9FT85_PAPLA|nr:hypothetical protein DB88DRAFT_485114 [Papiliotrema laurentii]
MFNLSDRLKAAVNQIEATGTSLSQRAVGQNQHHSQAPANTSQGSSSRPQTPVASRPSPSPISTDAAADKAEGSGTHAAVSPPKSAAGYASTTTALAEGALSGLRKSFHFSRQSLDGVRPGAASGPSSPKASLSSSTSNIKEQELKDIPTSPKAQSRPASPSRFLDTSFQLGSGPSSSGASPRAKSPQPSSSHLRTALKVTLPPDPDDPATFPLPPSPVVPTSPPPPSLSASTTMFGDPLGASPLLPPVEDVAVPTLGVEEPTPVEEKELEDVTGEGAGANGDAQAPRVSSDSSGKPEDGQSVLVEKNVDGSSKDKTTDEPSSAELEKAEKRYQDLSNRFTTLLTQKHNADKVLKELTPLEGGIADSEALEGWVRMMNGKVEMITEEMKRLQGKISLQESRIEELRDTHRLEGSSQTELITKLRSQLSTAESTLAQKATELMSLSKMKEELAKAQTAAKEEEEKRTKAISLLKTVRLKLVKLEKEKEEIERDRAEERAERSSAKDEVERVKAEKEREVNQLRKGFERELAGAKERFEKEMQTKKAAWELEMITTKAAHAKEISAKSTKVVGLEAIVKELNVTTGKQFEDLQAKQAEVESNRSELESLRNRTKELEFQLREAHERAAAFEDSPRAGRSYMGGLASRNVSPSPARGTSSPIEVQRLLADAEAKAEAKISDLRNKVHALEMERNEAEEEWAAKLSERVRELEKLRRVITEKEGEYAESLRSRQEKERVIEEAEAAKRAVEKEMKALRAEVEEAKANVTVAAEAERAAKDELAGLQVQISTLSGQLDEAKTHATTLKNNNKTLREELRKVQSSVQLMERSRNPGVGYWSSSNNNAHNAPKSSMTPPEPITPAKERPSMESARTGQSQAPSGTSTPSATVVSDARDKAEEEVNLEYLRNVILQFLEHKEMRPNLVRVLSVILRFTPQELRRLNAKVLA